MFAIGDKVKCSKCKVEGTITRIEEVNGRTRVWVRCNSTGTEIPVSGQNLTVRRPVDFRGMPID